MRSFPRATFVLLVCFLIASCDSAGPDPVEPPRALSVQEQQLLESNSEFGLKLFSAISSSEQGNVIISPLSVSMALGMTLNGAEGETRAAMEETLELAGLSQEEINQSYQSLIDLLEGLDPKVKFNIANSIWYREGFSVKQDFIEINEQYFDAVVQALDFQSPEAPERINGWVEDKTEGKIKKIIQGSIPPHTVMYLVNALYFQGDWRFQFDPDDTKQAPFTLPSGEEVPVEMMSLAETTLPFYMGEQFKAVDLPYGDSLYSMTILLPHEEARIDSLAAHMDEPLWTKIIEGLRPRELSFIKMPSFELRYKKKLNEVLKALGMEVAFSSGRANFDGINEQRRLWIDQVLHKTYIKVNEEGTEAAAVTSVRMKTISVSPKMRIDRPFIFVIRERHSGTILFIGKVTDPRA